MGILAINSVWCHAAERVGDLAWLEQYNIVWTSQSSTSGDSMPVSGGDIGLNVWMENNELMFYIGPAGVRSPMDLALGVLC